MQHDHAELGELLNELDAALEANDAARTHATLDLFWARLAMHIRAEHLHLFPAISRISNDQALAPGEPENTIAKLREDHDFFMRELSQSIAITRNAKENTAEQLAEVSKKIAAVRARLVKHNEIEETGIYVWSSSLLTEAEQSELTTQIQKELENLPPRFGDVDGSQ
ncbi:MAG TPA: hemerythrin domain-containing protein [Pyrinomonadaceae bacterium]|nr:hemerythrin domain-containing protein [Pyrinomonadaceae bacterium]